jgi:GT2 family glycosyltransferase
VESLTIVMPTYNRRTVLERTMPCWQALARQHAFLVIDDGSTDGTSDWLATQGVAVIRHRHRLGLPSARNHGLERAGTRWVLFGEDDVLMPADHGTRLLAEAGRLASLGPIGAVAGRLHAGSEWILPSERPSGAGTLLDLARLRGDFAGELPDPRPLPSLHACALVDRAAALAVGGYDRAFDGSSFREESDLYARLWRAGRACWLTPATWAVHVRHRLGGGCRGDHGWARKLANRWSHWRCNARYVDRHARLWRHWGADASPGRLKARWAGVIAGSALAAWRTR